MSIISCPECGSEISDTARNCPRCGYSFEKMKFCKFCGEKIPEDSVVCTKCGRQVENAVQSGGITINNAANSTANSNIQDIPKVQKRVDKVVALIICICLGWCGIHKFYEGKVGMGIVYIFTFGLFGIGWIVDIITIAMKPNPYYVQ